MFLNQVHYMWRDLGRAGGRRATLLVLGPAVVFVVLALPVALRATPALAEHADLSGVESRTGPEIHLRDSYQVMVTTTGGDCTIQVQVGPWGFGPDPFPSDATGSRTWVEKSDLVDVPDGLYRIGVTATRCGPWTVALDRE